MRQAEYDSRRHPVWTGILRVVATLAVATVVLGGLGLWTVQRSFPQVTGEVRVPGLESAVTVTRDPAGIPQLEADSALDLFAAQGFVHAQDRFWEMDFRRHVTAGRLSELFGASQVATDTFVRTLGWREVAEQEVAGLDEVSLSYYEAYARGVNAYLESRSGADLSIEYAIVGLQNPEYSPEPWTPADSVAWLKAMAWDLRPNLEDEIDRSLLAAELSPERVAELYPDYPYDEHPTIVTGGSAALSAATTVSSSAEADEAVVGATDDVAEVRAALDALPELLGTAGTDIGSNAWVVSGEHTESGLPLLANDPHLGPALPSIWYQMGLRCTTVSDACPFDVSGFTFSGLPGVVIGHNASIAWGFTNLGPDVADLFVERVDGDSYELDGKAVPMEIRRETIVVAGGDDVEIRVRSTGRGPIVTDLSADFTGIAERSAEVDEESDSAHALSLQWTALTPGRTPSSIFAMNAASDWDGFRAAARLFEVPSQNLVYADVEGNIGYQAPGLIPVRSAGDGTTPRAGWTSANGWRDMVPFDDLPSALNPASGYIVTANNAVTLPDDGPFLTADWDAGYRAQRIDRLIRAAIDRDDPVTATDMSAIQADDYNPMAERLVPFLLAADLPAHDREITELLTGWNFHDDADSAASAYMNVFWKTLLDDVFRPALPEDVPPAGGSQWFLIVDNLLDEPASAWWQDVDDDVFGRDDAIARAATSAWRHAARLMGPDERQWSWGELHRLDLRNASLGSSGIAPVEWLLNRGPFELSGGSSVVNAVGWDLPNGYAVDWVPSMRQVVDLSDFDESTWINLGGASGHAFHPHYTDQTAAWAAHETRPWPFSADATARAARHTLVLAP